MEELESHFQIHIEDNLRSGMGPEEARVRALLKLGGIEQTKEMAIEVCNDPRKNAAAGRLRDLGAYSKGDKDYRAKDFVNNLAVLGCMCHLALEQPDDALQCDPQ